ncbi:hypothetical protein [Litoribacillus peritrichatus]|uniref:Uncharacterized protein n=1 Tax=Litoribacillus peritrichatus TaxID=718191 RepID=A0ABP7MML2_9GAMM
MTHPTLKNKLFALGLSVCTCSMAFAVEPLNDEEMSDLVVKDPYGSTAAGGHIDTTLAGRTSSAESVDEANQMLANDPNLKLTLGPSDNSLANIGQPTVRHTSKDYLDGIQIQSVGTVRNVYIDQVFDNTGANRGSRSIENINVDTSASIYNFR